MNRFVALCLTAVVVTGCESLPFSPFISPRVTGRVLAADTRRPLADVTIRTGAQARGYGSGMPPKGGELLMARAPVRTDHDGRFELETERALTPFRGAGWFSVQLLFAHDGYESFRTNFSTLNVSTNAPNGEPLLDAGDILLRPEQK
jgi:hypothetical protein